MFSLLEAADFSRWSSKKDKKNKKRAKNRDCSRSREEEKHIRNSIKCERLVNLGEGEEEEVIKEEGKVKRLAHLLEQGEKCSR